MNIPPALREMYDALSSYNIMFLEHIKKNPGYLKRSQYSQLFEWIDPCAEVTMQPWPLFIGRQTMSRFEQVAKSLLELIKSIPRRLFANDPDRLSRYYNLPVEFVHQCLYGIDDEFMSNLLARGDFIFTPSGLKCVEYNISANLGGWELSIWESLSLRVPLISEFMKKYRVEITGNKLIFLLFEHLARISLKCFPHENEINIALVVQHQETLKKMLSMEEHLNREYQNSLRHIDKSNRLKGKVIFCNFDQLHLNGEYPYYKDKRIHMILDYYFGEIPFEFLILFKMRRVLLYDGPLAVILSSKLNLALLSEHEDSDLFTPGERETIKKYIPWTRQVTAGTTTYGNEKINLEEFMLSNKDKLVLKPSFGSGGEGVHIGYYLPEGQWKELVLKAFQEKEWAVQERIETHPFLFQWGEEGFAQCDTSLGLQVFGSRYAGVFARTVPVKYGKGVANVAQGGQVPVTFEVDK